MSGRSRVTNSKRQLLSSRDLNKIQEGIGEKVSMFVYFVASFASCITNAFLHGWELTLVILAEMPVSAEA